MSSLSVCSCSMPDLPENCILIVLVRHTFYKYRKSFTSEKNDCHTFTLPTSIFSLTLLTRVPQDLAEQNSLRLRDPG